MLTCLHAMFRLLEPSISTSTAAEQFLSGPSNCIESRPTSKQAALAVSWLLSIVRSILRQFLEFVESAKALVMSAREAFGF